MNREQSVASQGLEQIDIASLDLNTDWKQRVRSHLLTNADIVKMFLPVDIKKSLEWSFLRALPTEKGDLMTG